MSTPYRGSTTTLGEVAANDGSGLRQLAGRRRSAARLGASALCGHRPAGRCRGRRVARLARPTAALAAAALAALAATAALAFATQCLWLCVVYRRGQRPVQLRYFVVLGIFSEYAVRLLDVNEASLATADAHLFLAQMAVAA